MSQNDEKKLELEPIEVANYRVWKQEKNLSSEDIINNIQKDQNKIKHFTEALNEDEVNDKRKKIKNYQSYDPFKNRKQKDLRVSENVQKIMSEVGKLVLDMKHISENSYKNNISSLINTKNQIKKTEIMEEPNTILKIKEREYKASLEGKRKRPPNYQFLADSYRRQINKTFVNYNPNIHLSNIHKLRETEPETDKEYQIRLKEVNDFANIKNPLFFGKNYKIVENEEKSKEIKDDNNILEDKSIIAGNNSSIGYTIATAESENNNNSQIPKSQYSRMADNGFGKKIKNKKKKVELKKKFPEREKREKELNLMSLVLDNIGESLSNENMDIYYERYKDLPGTEISQQRHVFFNGMGKANKLLTEIQEILNYKDADDDANLKKRIVTGESDSLVDRLKFAKKSAINEIDTFEKKENKIFLQK